MPLSTGNDEWENHSYLPNGEVPWNDAGRQTPLESACKNWKVHVKTKREELGIKYRQMYWLLGRRSTLSLRNKLVLYTQLLKPVWTYGIQLWGCAAQSTIAVIQRFQNKVLRDIVNAPWYIRNTDLHRDLNMEMVTAVITTICLETRSEASPTR